MTIEGVEYFPFTVRFRLANGKRRVWVRWAPYYGALLDSLSRELSERFQPSELPHSTSIQVTAKL